MGSHNIEGSRLQFSFADSVAAMIVGLTLAREVGVDIEQVGPMPETESIAEANFLPHRSRSTRG